MATPSSVKSQSSAIVAFAEQIRDKLADTLDLAQYQPLYDTLKSRLDDLHLNHASVLGKLEHAQLIMGDKTNVKVVGTHSHSHPSQGNNFKCPFCASNHKAVDCNKYKSVQARKDRVIAQRLCFNCLIPGHSSKHCRRKKTCHICHLHHHTSLCNLSQTQPSSGNTSQPAKNNQSSNASRGSQQQQQHPHP